MTNRIPETPKTAKALIVIPVRNGAESIIQTIDSLYRQTETAFHCIIVDDYSTDNTQAMANWATSTDLRFNVARLYRPLGMAVASNIGKQIGAGILGSIPDGVMFLNSGDILAPNALGYLLSKKTKDVDPVGRILHSTGPEFPSEIMCSSGANLERVYKFEDVVNWGTLANISQILLSGPRLMECGGGFDDSLTRACNYDFYLRYTSIGGKFRFYPEYTLISAVPVEPILRFDHSIRDRIPMYRHQYKQYSNTITFTNTFQQEASVIIRNLFQHEASSN